jgi:predicted P-loop ATPase/GTPase
MNRMWDRQELERVNPMALAFTPPEIERIRETLSVDSGACIASRGDAER